VETNHGEGCQSVTGYSSKEFLDNPGLWINIVPEEDKPLVIEHANLMLSGIKASPMEHRILHKDGSVRWVRNTSVARFNNQGFVFAYDGLISDITDRKKAEENLREAEHKIVKAIITTEETERSRIAQDLHDGLGPVLSTIKLYFQVYLDTRDDTKKAELTAKLKNTIEEAIKGLSEISHNISPHVLKNHGFYAAIKQFFHQIALTNVVKLNFDDGHEPVINETNGIILYRAITELVNNSIKHAQCKNIDISFRQQNGFFHVEYSDDGKGFNESLITEPHLGSGLQNVRNRIKSLYGVVDIKSTLGQGMSAMIQIPQ
jgi:PAS domain S-box-containing protein